MVFLVGPALPVGGQWLLPLVSCNVIVTCLVPSPPPVGWGLWSFWLAPPCLWGGSGCCRLLVVVSSLRALSPPPPLWGGACGRFGWPRPACVGQCVLQRYVWYGCCRLLAVMSSLRARYHTKLLFSPCKRCPCPCSDAVHSPSSPPSGLRGFVPDRWEQGRFGGSGALGGPGGGGIPWGGGGGGWEPGTRQHIPLFEGSGMEFCTLKPL